MDQRTTRHTLTFSNAFMIEGVEREQPAGAYQVEFDEEAIDGLSFVAYRRVATRLHLAKDPAQPGITEVVEVPAADVAGLLALAQSPQPKLLRSVT